MDTFMGSVSKRKFNFTPAGNEVKRNKLSANSIVEDVTHSTSTPYTKKVLSPLHQEENISKRFLCPNIKPNMETLNSTNDEINRDSEDEEILFVGEIFPIEGQLEVLQKNIEICSRNFQKQCRYALATHKFDNLVTEHCMPCFTQINEAVKCPSTEAIKTTCRNLINEIMSYISRLGCSEKIFEDEKWIKVMSLGVTLSLKLLENKQDLRARNRNLSGDQLSQHFMTYNLNYLAELYMKLLYHCRNDKIAILSILIRIPPLNFDIQSQMLAKLIRDCLSDVPDSFPISSRKYLIVMLAYKKLNDLLPHNSVHIGQWKNTFNKRFPDKRTPSLILQFIKEQYPAIKSSFSQSLFYVPTSIETIYSNFQKFEKEKMHVPSVVYPLFDKDHKETVGRRRNDPLPSTSDLRLEKTRPSSKRLRSDGPSSAFTSSISKKLCKNPESDENLVMVIMRLQDFPTHYSNSTSDYSYKQPQSSRTNNTTSESIINPKVYPQSPKNVIHSVLSRPEDDQPDVEITSKVPIINLCDSDDDDENIQSVTPTILPHSISIKQENHPSHEDINAVATDNNTTNSANLETLSHKPTDSQSNHKTLSSACKSTSVQIFSDKNFLAKNQNVSESVNSPKSNSESENQEINQPILEKNHSENLPNIDTIEKTNNQENNTTKTVSTSELKMLESTEVLQGNKNGVIKNTKNGISVGFVKPRVLATLKLSRVNDKLNYVNRSTVDNDAKTKIVPVPKSVFCSQLNESLNSQQLDLLDNDMNSVTINKNTLISKKSTSNDIHKDSTMLKELNFESNEINRDVRELNSNEISEVTTPPQENDLKPNEGSKQSTKESDLKLTKINEDSTIFQEFDSKLNEASKSSTVTQNIDSQSHEGTENVTVSQEIISEPHEVSKVSTLLQEMHSKSYEINGGSTVSQEFDSKLHVVNKDSAISQEDSKTHEVKQNLTVSEEMDMDSKSQEVNKNLIASHELDSNSCEVNEEHSLVSEKMNSKLHEVDKDTNASRETNSKPNEVIEDSICHIVDSKLHKGIENSIVCHQFDSKSDKVNKNSTISQEINSKINEGCKNSTISQKIVSKLTGVNENTTAPQKLDSESNEVNENMTVSQEFNSKSHEVNQNLTSEEMDSKSQKVKENLNASQEFDSNLYEVNKHSLLSEKMNSKLHEVEKDTIVSQETNSKSNEIKKDSICQIIDSKLHKGIESQQLDSKSDEVNKNFTKSQEFDSKLHEVNIDSTVSQETNSESQEINAKSTVSHEVNLNDTNEDSTLILDPNLGTIELNSGSVISNKVNKDSTVLQTVDSKLNDLTTESILQKLDSNIHETNIDSTTSQLDAEINGNNKESQENISCITETEISEETPLNINKSMLSEKIEPKMNESNSISQENDLNVDKLNIGLESEIIETGNVLILNLTTQDLGIISDNSMECDDKIQPKINDDLDSNTKLNSNINHTSVDSKCIPKSAETNSKLNASDNVCLNTSIEKMEEDTELNSSNAEEIPDSLTEIFMINSESENVKGNKSMKKIDDAIIHKDSVSTENDSNMSSIANLRDNIKEDQFVINIENNSNITVVESTHSLENNTKVNITNQNDINKNISDENLIVGVDNITPSINEQNKDTTIDNIEKVIDSEENPDNNKSDISKEFELKVDGQQEISMENIDENKNKTIIESTVGMKVDQMDETTESTVNKIENQSIELDNNKEKVIAGNSKKRITINNIAQRLLEKEEKSRKELKVEPEKSVEEINIPKESITEIKLDKHKEEKENTTKVLSDKTKPKSITEEHKEEKENTTKVLSDKTKPECITEKHREQKENTTKVLSDKTKPECLTEKHREETKKNIQDKTYDNTKIVSIIPIGDEQQSNLVEQIKNKKISPEEKTNEVDNTTKNKRTLIVKNSNKFDNIMTEVKKLPSVDCIDISNINKTSTVENNILNTDSVTKMKKTSSMKNTDKIDTTKNKNISKKRVHFEINTSEEPKSKMSYISPAIEKISNIKAHDIVPIIRVDKQHTFNTNVTEKSLDEENVKLLVEKSNKIDNISKNKRNIPKKRVNFEKVFLVEKVPSEDIKTNCATEKINKVSVKVASLGPIDEKHKVVPVKQSEELDVMENISEPKIKTVFSKNIIDKFKGLNANIISIDKHISDAKVFEQNKNINKLVEKSDKINDVFKSKKNVSKKLTVHDEKVPVTSVKTKPEANSSQKFIEHDKKASVAEEIKIKINNVSLKKVIGNFKGPARIVSISSLDKQHIAATKSVEQNKIVNKLVAEKSNKTIDVAKNKKSASKMFTVNDGKVTCEENKLNSNHISIVDLIDIFKGPAKIVSITSVDKKQHIGDTKLVEQTRNMKNPYVDKSIITKNGEQLSVIEKISAPKIVSSENKIVNLKEHVKIISVDKQPISDTKIVEPNKNMVKSLEEKSNTIIDVSKNKKIISKKCEQLSVIENISEPKIKIASSGNKIDNFKGYAKITSTDKQLIPDTKIIEPNKNIEKSLEEKSNKIIVVSKNKKNVSKNLTVHDEKVSITSVESKAKVSKVSSQKPIVDLSKDHVKHDEKAKMNAIKENATLVVEEILMDDIKLPSKKVSTRVEKVNNRLSTLIESIRKEVGKGIRLEESNNVSIAKDIASNTNTFRCALENDETSNSNPLMMLSSAAVMEHNERKLITENEQTKDDIVLMQHMNCDLINNGNMYQEIVQNIPEDLSKKQICNGTSILSNLDVSSAGEFADVFNNDLCEAVLTDDIIEEVVYNHFDMDSDNFDDNAVPLNEQPSISNACYPNPNDDLIEKTVEETVARIVNARDNKQPSLISYDINTTGKNNNMCEITMKFLSNPSNKSIKQSASKESKHNSTGNESTIKLKHTVDQILNSDPKLVTKPLNEVHNHGVNVLPMDEILPREDLIHCRNVNFDNIHSRNLNLPRKETVHRQDDACNYNTNSTGHGIIPRSDNSVRPHNSNIIHTPNSFLPPMTKIEVRNNKSKESDIHASKLNSRNKKGRIVNVSDKTEVKLQANCSKINEQNDFDREFYQKFVKGKGQGNFNDNPKKEEPILDFSQIQRLEEETDHFLPIPPKIVNETNNARTHDIHRERRRNILNYPTIKVTPTNPMSKVGSSSSSALPITDPLEYLDITKDLLVDSTISPNKLKVIADEVVTKNSGKSVQSLTQEILEYEEKVRNIKLKIDTCSKSFELNCRNDNDAKMVENHSKQLDLRKNSGLNKAQQNNRNDCHKEYKRHILKTKKMGDEEMLSKTIFEKNKQDEIRQLIMDEWDRERKLDYPIKTYSRHKRTQDAKRTSDEVKEDKIEWRKKLVNNFINQQHPDIHKKPVYINIDRENLKPIRDSEFFPSTVGTDLELFSDVSGDESECKSASFKINPQLKDPLSLELKYLEGPPNDAILNEPISNNTPIPECDRYNRRPLPSDETHLVDDGAVMDMDIFPSSSILSDNDIPSNIHSISAYELYNSIEGENFNAFTESSTDDSISQVPVAHFGSNTIDPIIHDPCFAPQTILDCIVQETAAQHL